MDVASVVEKECERSGLDIDVCLTSTHRAPAPSLLLRPDLSLLSWSSHRRCLRWVKGKHYWFWNSVTRRVLPWWECFHCIHSLSPLTQMLGSVWDVAGAGWFITAGFTVLQITVCTRTLSCISALDQTSMFFLCVGVVFPAWSFPSCVGAR